MNKKERDFRRRFAKEARDKGLLDPETARQMGAEPKEKKKRNIPQNSADSDKMPTYRPYEDDIVSCDITGQYLGEALKNAGNETEERLLFLLDGEGEDNSTNDPDAVPIDLWVVWRLIDYGEYWSRGDEGRYTELKFQLEYKPELIPVPMNVDNPTKDDYGIAWGVHKKEQMWFRAINKAQAAYIEALRVLDTPTLFLYDRWRWRKERGDDVNFRAVGREFEEVFGTTLGHGCKDVKNTIEGRDRGRGMGVRHYVEAVLHGGDRIIEDLRHSKPAASIFHAGGGLVFGPPYVHTVVDGVNVGMRQGNLAITEQIVDGWAMIRKACRDVANNPSHKQ